MSGLPRAAVWASALMASITIMPLALGQATPARVVRIPAPSPTVTSLPTPSPTVTSLPTPSPTPSLTATPTPPAVHLSSLALDFSAQHVGVHGAAQTITLANTGGATVTVSGMAIVGVAASDFDETDTCVGVTLAPSATCTIDVLFTPTATGPRSTSLSVVDTAADSPQSVALTGAGLASSVDISPNSLDFGAHDVGAGGMVTTITVANGGVASLTFDSVTVSSSGDFSETDTCAGATLPPNGTCTVRVSFTPLNGGDRRGVLVLIDDAPDGVQSVTLSGTGTGVPTETAGPTVEVSPTVPLSSAAPMTLTATPTVPPTRASVVAQTRPLPATPTGIARTPHAQARRTHARHAQARGTHARARHTRARHARTPGRHHATGLSLTLRVHPTIVTAGNTVTISARAAPHAQVTLQLRVFPADTVLAHTTRHPMRSRCPVILFTLVARGMADAKGRFVRQVRIAYRPRRTTPALLMLTARTAHSLTSRTARLLIQPRRGRRRSRSAAYSVPTSGPAHPSAVLVSQTALAFGRHGVGLTSADQTVHIVNLDAHPLIITRVRVDGPDRSDFATQDTCAGVPIPPYQGCVIRVRFTPLRGGPRRATLLLVAPETPRPRRLPLSGTGVGRGSGH